MPKLTVDGRETEVRHGATVMEAANALGIYIPHFCYHKKLSIAANCRMCLVQVEKAPKPQPACATPVTDGMKVFTRSDYARQAQDGVMEFLLINHPLDCPICDQGGECQLQDLAVGYGKSASRYTEEKRVVLNKNLGPLISTDMTRCIHCTRCVRFGQELAGVMELGMIGRGEHAEILAFVGKTVDSELSGNMIALCPVGALASPHSTFEEMALLAKLMRAMGSDNVDFRVRQSDFSADGKRAGVPWLGMRVAELGALDRVLVVGSFLRKDHPLLASRLRQIAKRKSQINVLHCADDDLLMPVANKAIVRPGELAGTLAQVVKAVAESRQKPAPAELAGLSVGSEARAIAASLASGQSVAVLLGNLAAQHPQGAQLQRLAQELAALLGGRFGFLSEAANSVGGYLAGCVPSEGGLNARTLLEQPRKAYLLLNAEPDFDCHDPRTAIKAMGAADLVVAMAAYRSFAADYANVLLPIVPFTETSGTYVNCEGRMQSFNGAVKPLGEARPAWKVLRVLGNLMSLPGFDHESSEAVRDEVCRAEDVAGRLDNRLNGLELALDSASGEGLQRIADVPIYFGDPIVRRAASLQRTRDALPPRAWAGPMLAQTLALKAGEPVRGRPGQGEAIVELGIDERLPAGCVRLAAAHRHTASLGPMFGTVSVERT